MLEIRSSSNKFIKELKSLYRKKERWEKKQFLVEGIKMVEECINNKYEVLSIVYSEMLFNIKGGEDLFNSVRTFPKLIKVSDKIFREISDVKTPQGILAVARFKERDIEELTKIENSFIILLDRIQDPGNMGTIIRTADAFGADGIIVNSGSVDIYNPKVVRATMGSIFRTNIYFVDESIHILKELKEKGIKVYSTSLQGKRFIQDVDFRLPSLLIIGNESKGVSNEYLNMADELIKIPMVGGAESLNAAVASSIIMYEILRQRS